jgi:putative DNA primase/helicase
MTADTRPLASAIGHVPPDGGSERTLNFQVPDDLKELDQWVVWRYERRNGKPTKVPCRTSGELASVTNPSTWTSFERALECWRQFPRQYAGIGFVFSAADPYCGIDLDGCIDDAGQVKV